MVLATCGVWGAYRVSKWRDRSLGALAWAACSMLAVPELGGRGVTAAASAQSRAPRGRAARAAAVSSVALRPVLPSCRACRVTPCGVWRAADLNLSYERSGSTLPTPPNEKGKPERTDPRKRPGAHDTSPSAPTRTHSELMTLCDHILIGRSRGRSCSESELPYVPAISALPQERLPAAAAY